LANSIAAQIIGAWIAIIAVHRSAEASIRTTLVNGAGVTVIAIDRCILTLPAGTYIGGAYIVVITIHRSAEASVGTALVNRARIAVIAVNGCGGASGGRITAIGGTRISIIADH